MSDLQIVCDNCGAKYRLPASFSGDRAKCQKCGSAIDVAAQKAVTAAPAAAQAAAATRPAAKPQAGAERPARTERSPRGERPSRTSRADASRGRRGKREQSEPAKKGHKMLLVGGGLAALAIVAVIVVLITSSRNEPKAGASDTATAPASAQHTEPGQAADAASRALQWQSEPAKTMADVYRPQELGAVTWPADVAAAQKTESRALAADVSAGRAAAARPKLEQLGYPAVFAIVEALRQLDYTAVADQQKAAEFNKALATICSGVSAGFVAVPTDAPLDPRLASWNARTNKFWAQWLSQCSSKAAFDGWKQQHTAAAREADKK